MAPLGMKSNGGTAEAIRRKVLTAEETLRYAMSLPVATTISGIDSLEVLRQNLGCAPYAGDGHLELYKSTMYYDGDVGREQHGFPSQEELPM
jgi:hypothetical protein